MVFKDGQVLRPYEQYQYHKNNHKVTSCFLVGFELNKELDPEVIEGAVRKLYDSRIRLRFNIFEEDGKPVARELKQFPSSSIEFWDNNDDDEPTLLNKLHDIDFKFGIQETTWKIIVVNNKWVYVLCEHTLFDGTSAALILEDLLTILNNDELPKDPNPDESELFQISKASYSYLLGKAIELWTPSWLNNKFRQYFDPLSQYESLEPGWKEIKEKKWTYQYKVHIISIDKSDFEILKNLGKSRGIKFTSLWSYLSLLAFAKIKNENITMSVPYNVRPFLSNAYQRTYGLIVSGIQNIYTPPIDQHQIDWEYCKFLESTLQKDQLIKFAGQIGILDYYKPLDLLKSSITKPRGTTLEVSNLGLRDSHEGHAIIARQFMFSQASSLTGASITQSLASTKEKVNISIGCVPEFEEYFDEYIKNLEGLLKDTVNGVLV